MGQVLCPAGGIPGERICLCLSSSAEGQTVSLQVTVTNQSPSCGTQVVTIPRIPWAPGPPQSSEIEVLMVVSFSPSVPPTNGPLPLWWAHAPSLVHLHLQWPDGFRLFPHSAWPSTGFDHWVWGFVQPPSTQTGLSQFQECGDDIDLMKVHDLCCASPQTVAKAYNIQEIPLSIQPDSPANKPPNVEKFLLHLPQVQALILIPSSILTFVLTSYVNIFLSFQTSGIFFHCSVTVRVWTVSLVDVFSPFLLKKSELCFSFSAILIELLNIFFSP